MTAELGLTHDALYSCTQIPIWQQWASKG